MPRRRWAHHSVRPVADPIVVRLGIEIATGIADVVAARMTRIEIGIEIVATVIAVDLFADLAVYGGPLIPARHP